MQVLNAPALITHTDFVARPSQMPSIEQNSPKQQYAHCFVRSTQPFMGFYQNTFDGAMYGLDLQNTYGQLRIVKANKGIDKEAYFQKRLTAYKKALELDGNNFSANYNMGITYYNRAVDIINDQSYDLDVAMLTKIIDQCSAMFKEAQPFLEKAHKLTPANKNTMLALEGVYYNMNDAHKMKQSKKAYL